MVRWVICHENNISSVSHRKPSGERHEQLVKDLKELHQKWTGDRETVSLVYRTEVYLSQAQL